MKRTDTFAFSTYLAMALSTAALGYMERLHISWVALFYLAMEALLLAAFFVRDRWFIPRRAANAIALLVTTAWLAWFWIDMRLVTSQNPFALDLMPWVMPRIGPVLSFLMVVKMLRPKRTRDYWLLHALALTQIALACVLDRDAVFAMLLFGYFVAAVWSLKDFHQYREVRGDWGLVRTELIPFYVSDRPFREGFRKGLGWTTAGLVVGLTIFFALPRRGQGVLLSETVTGVTGFNPSGVDLTIGEPMAVSSDLVMRVEARNSAGEPVNMGPDQRWRGLTCSYYRDGHWRPFPPRPANDEVSVDFPHLPPLGPDELHLTFQVDMLRTRRGGQRNVALDSSQYGIDYANPIGPLLFMAEPPAFREDWGLPLVHVHDSRVKELIYRVRENTLHSPITFRNGRLTYHQICKRPFGVQHQWSPPVNWWRTKQLEGTLQGLSTLTASTWLSHPITNIGVTLPFRVIGRIEANSPDMLDEGRSIFETPADPRYYYKGILLRLPADSKEVFKKRAEEILEQSDLLNARQEQKAFALEKYLAGSGRYTYSLERIPRQRRTDPTIDFLFNTKVGHCEHFASALALMLRSLGIPARVVTGFHGADWNPYGHFHEIRQFHSHAWVEALVERPPSAGEMPRNRWLTLDPTPTDGIAAARAVVPQPWFASEIQFLVFLWESFILDYGEEQWHDLAEELPSMAWMKNPESFTLALPDVEGSAPVALMFCAFMLLVVGGATVWRWRQRRKGSAFVMATRVAFYRRALRLLGRLSLQPRPAQTPREFAGEVAAQLRHHPFAAEAATATDHLTTAFYEVRYGGAILGGERLQGIERDLECLAEAVRNRKRAASRRTRGAEGDATPLPRNK